MYITYNFNLTSHKNYHSSHTYKILCAECNNNDNINPNICVFLTWGPWGVCPWTLGCPGAHSFGHSIKNLFRYPSGDMVC